MSLPNMKIRIEGPFHNADVQDALYNHGYKWPDAVYDKNEYKFLDEPIFWLEAGSGLYNDIDNGIARCYVEGYTPHQDEYYLKDGNFFPVHARHEEYQAYQAERGPIGLTPKYIRDSERVQEILEAMLRFLQAGKEIPVIWYEELGEYIYNDDGDNF